MMRCQHPGGLVLTQQVIAYCAFAAGAKVVDIGCGAGTTVEYLRTVCGLDAVGVDLSEVRLEQGRSRSAGLPLLQAAGEQLPFADAAADGVIAECSLSVMQDAGKVVAESSRILVDGGRLAITDVYVRNPDDSLSACQLPGAGVGRDLTRLLAKNAFQIIVWEDRSVLLPEFVASYIMEHGSIEDFWQGMAGNDLRQSARQTMDRPRLGYFLLVAEKRKPRG
jgi:SAM-dependent methyltransferase